MFRLQKSHSLRLTRLPLALVIALLIIVEAISAADLQDLKLLDTHGLVRSHTRVTGPRSVEIRISVTPGGAPILSNVDGLATDIEGEATAPNTYRFNKVQPGSWKISGGEFEVERVEIH